MTIVKGAAAAAVEVTVTNTITRDRGTLMIEKQLTNPSGAPIPATFEISYNCGLDTDGTALTGTKNVAPGTPQYVYNIPTGNTCEITEVTPTPIPGFTWEPVSYSPKSVVISTKDATFTVKAVNSIMRKGLITDTMLCTMVNNEFRLVYTPDNQLGQNIFKLNASNPGQFYYNIFLDGTVTSIVVTLPFPWVTQGAVPIHMYSDVGIVTTNGITCLTPVEPPLGINNQQITLPNYQSQTFGTTTTLTIGNIPLGTTYLNIHLDFGLKGTTNWSKIARNDNGNTVYDAQSLYALPLPEIFNGQKYNFSDDQGGTADAYSTNSFKKNPGVGGLSEFVNGDAVKGATVKIYQGNKLMATVTSDEDGWFMWQYKWTGKRVTFSVDLTWGQYHRIQNVVLKANGFIEVDFLDITSP